MIDMENMFNDSETTKIMGDKIRNYCGKSIKLMEVCGTHTMAILKYGIKNILPESMKLISGPGCPVCVTPSNYIGKAIALSKKTDVIITTFGDMMKVPSNGQSLLEEKAKGSDIRIIYSPFESLKIASKNLDKKIIFLSVGFETTTPVCALAIIAAKEMKLTNFFILTANKTIPKVLQTLVTDEKNKIDGFIYPGHVSAITGNTSYREIAEKYGIPGVVAGFEPMDVLHAIITLTELINKERKDVINEYSRVVNDKGNLIAHEKVYEVFEACDSWWRGFGNIELSGLKLKKNYNRFDAEILIDSYEDIEEEPQGCLCAEVLKGRKNPNECLLFGKACTPENPIGACMVSSEGTCAAYFKYGY